MKHLLTVSVLCGAVRVLATPTVSNVAFVQDDATRRVNVTYDLEGGAGECGIVTFDVLTNGVSIGPDKLWSVSGDVNRKLSVGTAKKIQWDPTENCPFDLADAQIAPTVWSTNAPPPVMVLSLTASKGIFYYADYAALPGGRGISNDVYKSDWMVLRKIPAAGVEWVMGKSADFGKSDGCGRAYAHKVRLNSDYYIAVYPITWAQYRCVDSPIPNDSDACKPFVSSYGGWRGKVSNGINWPTLPAGNLHQIASSSRLQQFRTFTGVPLDMPTDAEWEFACHAGTGTVWNNGGNTSDSRDIDRVCWCKGNCTSLQPVGLKEPNAWGLYDMHGNTKEWVLDWCQNDLRGEDVAVDPKGPDSATYRVVRGGMYQQTWEYCHSIHRNEGVPEGNESWAVRPACPAVVTW